MPISSPTNSSKPQQTDSDTVLTVAELERRLRDYSERGFGDWSEDLLYVTQRLRNPGRFDDAAAVVPRINQGIRIPHPTNFRVYSTTDYGTVTEFVLTWTDVEDIEQVDRYKIYAYNVNDPIREPFVVGEVAQSPAKVQVTSVNGGPVVFFIKTILKNGYTNDLSTAPSCTGNAGAYSLGTSSAVALATATGTGSFTASNTIDVYWLDASGGNVTVNLPAATARTTPLYLKRIDGSANTVTINRAGADTIDGVTSYSMSTQYQSIMLLSDGVNKWYKLAFI